MDCLAGERSRAERLGTTFSMCLIDIDHFKAINDTLGHAAGDAVLKELPRSASAGLRSIDVFGRFGGEEFLLILPGTAAGGRAGPVAERVRRAIEAARFAALPSVTVTATIGVAQLAKGEDIAALLARADRALYAGKGAGVIASSWARIRAGDEDHLPRVRAADRGARRPASKSCVTCRTTRRSTSPRRSSASPSAARLSQGTSTAS